MTTHTLTLSDFLLARIAADEEVARAATMMGGEWQADDNDVRREFGIVAKTATTPRGSLLSRKDAAHIARHDPARVLAECEAKRRIVEEFTDEMHAFGIDRTWRQVTTKQGEIVLVLLASVYADHPDYREEWRL